jgi:type I restriction enzyme M protein
VLDEYWQVCPDLRATLFKRLRSGYLKLSSHFQFSTLNSQLKNHPEFAAFIAGLEKHFAKWRKTTAASLRKLQPECHPKEVIRELSENLLAHAEGKPLIDPYAVYQHLMDYWAETMQDDCYLVSVDGWVAKTNRILETDKKGKTKDKGWTCDLVPKSLVVARYFAKQQAAIESQQAALEASAATLAELEEEHGGEEGFLGMLDKIAKAEITARLREWRVENGELKMPRDLDHSQLSTLNSPLAEAAVLQQWLKLNTEQAELKRDIREAEAALDQLAYEKYPQLSEAEVQTLVVDDKWLTTLAAAIQSELDRVSQTLTSRIRLLADRYASPLPQIADEVEALSAKVDEHLKKMGVLT